MVVYHCVANLKKDKVISNIPYNFKNIHIVNECASNTNQISLNFKHTKIKFMFNLFPNT